MKRLTRNIHAAFLLAVMLALAACGSVNLDTTNKRFAAFELSYKSALTQIDAMDKSNSFKPETRPKVAAVLKDVNKARDAAYAAKNLGDITEAQNQLSLAIALLDHLKTLLPAGGQI